MVQRTRKKKKPTAADGALNKVFEQAEKKTSGNTVCLEDVERVYKGHCYGPLLLLFALVALFPVVGGLPFVSMIIATLIILTAVQMPFREHPWSPRWLRTLGIPRSKFIAFIHQAQHWTGWLGHLVRPRLTWLTERPWLYVVAAACIFLGLLFYPLDWIPFAVAVPALVVAILGLGLTAHDGALVVLGLILTAAPVALLIWLWPF